MAAIPHKTKNGVRYETSGSGFHTKNRYGKDERRAEKDEIEAEIEEFSQEKLQKQEKNKQND